MALVHTIMVHLVASLSSDLPFASMFACFIQLFIGFALTGTDFTRNGHVMFTLALSSIVVLFCYMY